MDGSEILRLKYTEDIYLNTQILREYAHLRVRVRGVAGRGGAGRAGLGRGACECKWKTGQFQGPRVVKGLVPDTIRKGLRRHSPASGHRDRSSARGTVSRTILCQNLTANKLARNTSSTLPILPKHRA